MQNSTTSSRLLMGLLHFATFMTLQWAYLNGIAFVFASDGYARIFGGAQEVFSASKTAVAATLAFLLPLTVSASQRPSTLFLHATLAFTITPTLVIYASVDLPHEFMVISVFAFLIVNIVSRFPVLSIGVRPSFHSRFMLLVSVCAISVFVASFLVFDGFRYLNFDISRVYDFRTEASENLPGIYSYLLPMSTKVLIPFAMVLACVHRALWLALLLGGCSVLLFALTSNKAPLFYPLAVLGVYYIYPLGRIPAWLVFVVLCAAIISGVAVQFYLAEGSEIGLWTAALLGNRSLMLPALINYAYYDQFAHGVQYWWSESRLSGGLVSRPFPEASPNLIGVNYFGRNETFANTGWIGSGHAQAGILGVIFYSIGVGITFLIVDGFARKFGARIAVSMFIILVLVMVTSSDFIVMFLTHGMLLAFILARFTDGKSVRHRLAVNRAEPVQNSRNVRSIQSSY